MNDADLDYIVCANAEDMRRGVGNVYVPSLVDEIKSLRHERDRYLSESEGFSAEVVSLQAENKRLRKKLEMRHELRNRCNDMWPEDGAVDRLIAAMDPDTL